MTLWTGNAYGDQICITISNEGGKGKRGRERRREKGNNGDERPNLVECIRDDALDKKWMIYGNQICVND